MAKKIAIVTIGAIVEAAEYRAALAGAFEDSKASLAELVRSFVLAEGADKAEARYDVIKASAEYKAAEKNVQGAIRTAYSKYKASTGATMQTSKARGTQNKSTAKTAPAKVDQSAKRVEVMPEWAKDIKPNVADWARDNPVSAMMALEDAFLRATAPKRKAA